MIIKLSTDKYLLHLFLILNFVLFSYSHEENNEPCAAYNFKIETIVSAGLKKNVPAIMNGFPHNPGYALEKLNEEDYKNLCLTAKWHASLDGLAPSTPEDWYKLDYYCISYRGRGMIQPLAIKCQTIPETYLRLGNSDREIIIMQRENKFMKQDYIFKVETVYDLSPKEFEKSKSNHWLRIMNKARRALSDDQTRLDICLAAKEHVQRRTRILPVLLNSKVNEPEMLNFKAQGNRMLFHPAIECPSSPTIYVCYEGLDKNFTVILAAPSNKS